ncbi:sigma-70 family RNA polymerase sigma factor [Variovorax arabinosiphilus]|uniref:sigma-70 family RNA polymerase sigma factor n=1 Tax=Variovorax arabinosiphilus TaxID=3053498 RepID=UPI002577F497|nr:MULTISPECIES: sigma-70 family RNA polymerase sigma factor [unclassified Variovorax]MDM0122202.1 sigma-70 family RNA polymerase sigma factor [Variovorax sp. J2L1-78]MDM0131269.1 sigma-70 family RNA polymerase sigma factor [Variovorax sp. J2L1-63]MDM0234965.1 sigma-70 family RNA polymerase sigma factor [Variovorax sp. J2R1-6]
MPATSDSISDGVDAGSDLPGLWHRWRADGDRDAREALIRHHMPFARMMAATVFSRRTHNDVEFDDYLQLASIGLVEAVDRFDPDQGAQFKTFASKRVQGAVLNGLVKLTEKNQQIHLKMRLRQERLDAAKDAARETTDAGGLQGSDKLFRYLAEVGIGLALGFMLEDTGMVDAESFDGEAQAPSPEVSYFRQAETTQLRSLLRSCIAQLSEQQKLVISYHYLQEIPFDEIAQTMGVTRGRISQLHRQGLSKLREALSNDVRCDVSL